MRMNDHNNTSTDYMRSRELRNKATPYEKKLWVALRKEAAREQLKFRRQQAIHPYIVDFACMKARLVIELDGYSHDVRVGYDKVRDKTLKEMGFVTLRFRNEDISHNTEGVVMTIIEKAKNLIVEINAQSGHPHPLPSPPREGGESPLSHSEP